MEMRVIAAAVAALCVTAAGPGTPAAVAQDAPEKAGIHLYDGLGDHRMEVTVEGEEARAYFDQGLALTYAFNHALAVESFREAARRDPGCAMCWWGVALASGPNINAAMDSASGATAYEAAGEAEKRAPGVKPRERAYIEAVAARYGPDPTAERARRDSAYARAMEELADRFPGDDDAWTLRGEAVMLLSPWDYWEKGELKPRMEEAVAGFERVIERNPRHVGACHFYIHAVEEVEPARAVPCAERLPDLMPAAGHIVHMPAHVFIRVGRYDDAIATNRHAAHADREMIPDLAPDGTYRLGYVPHNHHFLWFAAEMAGRSSDAIGAAEETASLVDRTLMTTPGLEALQHYLVTPLFAYVRFGRWDEILATERPADPPYPMGIWHYARALAFAAGDDLDAADLEVRALDEVRRDPTLEGTMIWGVNSAAAVLEIASEVVKGELAAARGDHAAAERHLRRGVELEAELLYDEPPTWHLPVRHRLGAALLEAGRPADAEEVYRQDLERFPDNGWSLAGLARALRAQGRSDEAAEVEARLREAWAGADVEPGGSVF